MIAASQSGSQPCTAAQAKPARHQNRHTPLGTTKQRSGQAGLPVRMQYLVQHSGLPPIIRRTNLRWLQLSCARAAAPCWLQLRSNFPSNLPSSRSSMAEVRVLKTRVCPSHVSGSTNGRLCVGSSSSVNANRILCCGQGPASACIGPWSS